MVQWYKLPNLKKDDYVPLYVQLSNILGNYIRENGLDEGETIPSENDLTAHYHISRNTVRQAFQILESQDIIRRMRGRGTFVAVPKRKQALTGLKIIETRLRELGVEVANQPLYIQETFPPRDWGRRLGLASSDKAVLLRRIKTADGVPFALEERVFPLDVGRCFSEEDLKYRSVNLLLDAFPQHKVLHVLYNFTSSPLTATEAKELKVDRSEPVVRRVGLYRNSEDNPVMFGRLTFLADRIELKFEFIRSEDENWTAIAMS
jgi:GntR family transcriptional regulator